MSEGSRFSDRHGFRELNEAEITVRYDAPHELRGVIIDLAYECGFRPKTLRTLVCQALRKRADSSNWSEYPNIDDEVRRHLDNTEWYKVYDVIEAIAENAHDSEKFESELNIYLIEQGIGWKLVNGNLEARNPEVLEQTIQSATIALQEAGSQTARGELHEALVDLSRRPEADITGSIQHAMAALECVVRAVANDHKATLGELLKRYPDMIPAPLNQSIEKLWGFASEYGRHIREGRNPEFSEAQLVVGVCAAAVTYLIGKKNV